MFFPKMGLSLYKSLGHFLAFTLQMNHHLRVLSGFKLKVKDNERQSQGYQNLKTPARVSKK